MSSKDLQLRFNWRLRRLPAPAAAREPLTGELVEILCRDLERSARETLQGITDLGPEQRDKIARKLALELECLLWDAVE